MLVKALYGTKSAANRWHAHLADTLRSMHFASSRYDPDIWLRMRADQTGYNYIGTHMDDLMVVAKDLGSHLEVLKTEVCDQQD